MQSPKRGERKGPLSHPPTLVEWARQRGRGAYTELLRASRVSYTSVLKAARDGLPVTYEVAEQLSAATGGAVPIDVIRRGVSP